MFKEQDSMLFFSDIALTTRLLQGESTKNRQEHVLSREDVCGVEAIALDKPALTMREMKSFGLVMTAAREMLSLP